MLKQLILPAAALDSEVHTLKAGAVSCRGEFTHALPSAVIQMLKT